MQDGDDSPQGRGVELICARLPWPQEQQVFFPSFRVFSLRHGVWPGILSHHYPSCAGGAFWHQQKTNRWNRCLALLLPRTAPCHSLASPAPSGPGGTVSSARGVQAGGGRGGPLTA